MTEDPFNLQRFITAQEEVYDQALEELKRGRKETHWIWFIFPQIEGLGRSEMAQRYSIKSRQEAEEYLKHPVLGPRLVECCNALLYIHGKSICDIMGFPDDLKLASSMTLFAGVSKDDSVFREVIDKYFQRQTDPRTIEILAQG